MYVCLYVCMYVCMYVYIYVCMYVLKHVRNMALNFLNIAEIVLFRVAKNIYKFSRWLFPRIQLEYLIP